MCVVVEILDPDRSGKVSSDEFISKIHYTRHGNPHTLLVFIKHQIDKRAAQGIMTDRAMAAEITSISGTVNTMISQEVCSKPHPPFRTSNSPLSQCNGGLSMGSNEVGTPSNRAQFLEAPEDQSCQVQKQQEMPFMASKEEYFL